MACSISFDPETASILENKLSQIWEEFREEYERVFSNDLEARYLGFVTIEEAQ